MFVALLDKIAHVQISRLVWKNKIVQQFDEKYLIFAYLLEQGTTNVEKSAEKSSKVSINCANPV